MSGSSWMKMSSRRNSPFSCISRAVLNHHCLFNLHYKSKCLVPKTLHQMIARILLSFYCCCSCSFLSVWRWAMCIFSINDTHPNRMLPHWFQLKRKWITWYNTIVHIKKRHRHTQCVHYTMMSFRSLFRSVSLARSLTSNALVCCLNIYY